MNAVVAAVSRSAKHTLVKCSQDSIRLLPGLGVDGAWIADYVRLRFKAVQK